VKPKAELMARLRARRQADGWVQVNVWVPRELVPKLRAYVKRLTSSAKPVQRS
jgi:hypothetical protein